MIRAWLRRWLGIDQTVQLVQLRLDNAEQLISQLKQEIAQLRMMRMFREDIKHVHVPPDWERVQAEYAADPQNFLGPKEN